jgi:diguanylate cyclase (GGDEF)-like protein
MIYSEDDLASSAHDLLAVASNWTLVRHQWLMLKMRSILTGENSPPHRDLIQFDDDCLNRLNLPDHLLHNFTALKDKLEKAWLHTANINHPLSGLSLFDQLNIFQQQAHQFMLDAQDFNQQLWRDFTMRDPLTGTFTRLTLKSCLLQELTRGKRLNLPCSIALLDQNNFKKINDLQGHSMGDSVLSVTAELIQANLRPQDKLFRYGGDEWLILMPNTSAKIASNITKRIQKIVANHQFFGNNGAQFKSSFSYGVAECLSFDSTEAWFAAADQDLYLNKNKLPETLNLEFS